MAHTGTTAQPYQFVGQLRYYTHWQDAHLTLLQLGVRFYDPQVGRFGQVDPIMLFTSAYPYCSDRSTRFADPTGYDWKEDLWGQGKICVDSSCYGKNYFPSGMENIPDLSKPEEHTPLPAPPKPSKACGKKKPKPRCANTDGIYVPPKTDFDVDGLPQRPSSKHTILKISDGWMCTFTCDDKAKKRIKLTCSVYSTIPGPKFRPPIWIIPAEEE